MNVYVPVASAAAPGAAARRQASKVRSPLWRLVRIALPIALFASVGLFQAFTHVRVVSAGYDLGRLEAEHRRLLAERDRLRVEIATLRAPGRLERFARAQLRMAPPAPGTIVAGWAGVAAAGRAVRAGEVEDRRPAPVEPLSTGARLALRQTGRAAEVR
jgi:cell division protein FtsL